MRRGGAATRLGRLVARHVTSCAIDWGVTRTVRRDRGHRSLSGDTDTRTCVDDRGCRIGVRAGRSDAVPPPGDCRTGGIDFAGAMRALFEIPMSDGQPAVLAADGEQRPERAQARPRRAADRPQRPAARRGDPCRLAAADRRRRRLRQDPGADPPHRLPARRARRASRPDHRDHLHQQGRRRDEGAGGRAGRRPGPADVGVDVPLGLRAHPARRARARRPQVDVLDLRRRRLAPADAAGGPRARPRPQALPGPRSGRPGLQPEERADRPGDVRRPGQRARWSGPSPRRTRSTSGGSKRRTRSTSTT